MEPYTHQIKGTTSPKSDGPSCLFAFFRRSSAGGVAFEGDILKTTGNCHFPVVRKKRFGEGRERLMGDEAVCIWEKKEEQRRWNCTILGKEKGLINLGCPII
ncbi:hypothetical protein H5410_037739 [Solanum commersonii]|uniref:Uncharacterized protein n=1 Tax=Solanum commersonii TaxID=4109 RepID=A0A9J5Y742_SOLCO|nr:hypothetical protein H5410_037739 [Solanum commersonii]